MAGSAFMNSGVTNLDLSKATKLITIQPASFQGCASLSTITLPNSLTTIGNNAFQGSGLTSIDLSNTKITTIAESTFDTASKLASVNLPATVTSISQRAFNSTSSLKTLTQVAPATPGRYANSVAKEGQGATLSSAITSIGQQAFASTGLTSIDLSAMTVTSLNSNNIFQNAGSLSSVNLPKTLTSIPTGFFLSCASLSTVTLPGSITSIGNQAFQGSGLTSLDLSQTQVRTIGSDAFNGATKLATLKLPTTGLTSIGDRAFQGAFTGDSALKTLPLPSSVTSIGQSAFQSSGLTSIDLANTQVTTIQNSTFNGAASLATVKLPATVTSIGDSAFQGTTKLATLTQQGANSGSERADEPTNKLSSSINSIGSSAFRQTGLENISLKDTKVTGADGDTTHSFGNNVFWGATKLNNLQLPDGLTTIPAGMVAGATVLTTLTIPTTVTKINDGNSDNPGAFQGSGLTSIDLSNTALTK